MTLAHAIERLYALKVDTTTRDGDGTPHEKPHKPLLLLKAFNLIDPGLAVTDYIARFQEIRDRHSGLLKWLASLANTESMKEWEQYYQPPAFSRAGL